ncbi:hypothetical protein B0H17DRAFT_1102723 [Mycena rosella]|uniref:Uncharacterized protein n=1 Tax=Mycena rosella TaxID=1033263 RepID=A0AAD7G136_MYCRO|nr:hypothetical protein B0H17DRAFT_1102723 [Mycena rosella]
MASFKPPPPVVLLLLQTDLNTHISTGLMIHEDLEPLVPSAKKKVVFAPAPSLEHTYPPPPIFAEKIPTPTMLTRKILERHDAWEGGQRETALIKTTVHALVDQLLDKTKAISEQDTGLVQEVFRQAAQMHPDLHKYEDDWATCCIVQARLKATSSNASNKANKEAVAGVANIVQTGGRTRSSKQS